MLFQSLMIGYCSIKIINELKRSYLCIYEDYWYWISTKMLSTVVWPQLVLQSFLLVLKNIETNYITGLDETKSLLNSFHSYLKTHQIIIIKWSKYRISISTPTKFTTWIYRIMFFFINTCICSRYFSSYYYVIKKNLWYYFILCDKHYKFMR